MNRITLFISTLIGLLFSQMVLAQFTFYSDDPNACSYVSGEWVGKGKGSNWLLSCAYQGSETISPLDKAGNFTLIVDADKKSGNILCPAHINKKLRGSCVNSVVTIVTDYGDLEGTFTQASGDAKGVLTFDSGSTADVVIKFNRAG